MLDVQIIHDLGYLSTVVTGNFLETILQLLSSCTVDVLDSVKQSILHGGKSLYNLMPKVIGAIVASLVEKSVEVNVWFLCMLSVHEHGIESFFWNF